METGKPLARAYAPMERWLDRAIVGLAFASVLVFALALVGVAHPLALTILDISIVAAYALIFAAKGLLDEQPARWFRRHVWLALALLPLTVPVLIVQPYFILVQVVILLARSAKAIDRALHLRVVAGLSERYRARLAEEVSQPLLLNLANALEEALVSRDFGAVFGARLAERRDLVEAAVRRGIASNPRLSRFASFPPVQRFVDETTRDVVEAAHAALASPETTELMREAFRDAFRELKVGIAEPKWPHKGIGPREAAHRVAVATGLTAPTTP